MNKSASNIPPIKYKYIIFLLFIVVIVVSMVCISTFVSLCNNMVHNQ